MFEEIEASNRSFPNAWKLSNFGTELDPTRRRRGTWTTGQAQRTAAIGDATGQSAATCGDATGESSVEDGGDVEPHFLAMHASFVFVVRNLDAAQESRNSQFMWASPQ